MHVLSESFQLCYSVNFKLIVRFSALKIHRGHYFFVRESEKVYAPVEVLLRFWDLIRVKESRMQKRAKRQPPSPSGSAANQCYILYYHDHTIP